MPELPEVQTVVNNLTPLIIDHTIKNIDVYYPKMIQNDLDEFTNTLKGLKFTGIRRRGKYILFDLNHGKTLISHLRMEGKYSVLESSDQIPKHTHVVFNFDNGQRLAYHDTRKFGRMHLVDTSKVDVTKEIKKLGLEPFDKSFTGDALYQLLEKKKGKIKVVLLSQEVVVGLGNIYVDEVLYYAKIHPASIANHLTKEDAELICEGSKKILKSAIKYGGTTIFSFKNANGQIGHFQDHLKVHSQDGKTCERDGNPISKIKLDGRSTYFCSKCQILK
ncbi:DNA-formamidopyrimidine glycosylase [Xylocopilactobacillus apis]|uniref:Formamidopyrimidine-DNA glycosylase n=1 Tax=Xylocopilactobacillus apis TaxID=2932183 RepID=A0AAU9CYB9_9LACO|nr:DNA-formamidopyrimidine glycosylase [Xylocopilactobacillus apis]BDR56394.1 formamidopyrimidine-DNA glycosylase [Xylocopilactobacillus apis]